MRRQFVPENVNVCRAACCLKSVSKSKSAQLIDTCTQSDVVEIVHTSAKARSLLALGLRVKVLRWDLRAVKCHVPNHHHTSLASNCRCTVSFGLNTKNGASTTN